MHNDLYSTDITQNDDDKRRRRTTTNNDDDDDDDDDEIPDARYQDSRFQIPDSIISSHIRYSFPHV